MRFIWGVVYAIDSIYVYAIMAATCNDGLFDDDWCNVSTADVSPPEQQGDSGLPEGDALQQVTRMVDAIRNTGSITEEERHEVMKEVRRKKQFGIMACGVTGTGKSTLLNGIVGKCVFKEGDTLQHKTVKVNKHILEEDNHHLIVCDTPGFCDSSGDEERYIRIIGDACKDVDVLLYCISMRQTKARMDNQDVKTLKNLKRALKKEIWEHCVVVLTFANSEINRLKGKNFNGADLKKEFYSKIQLWKKKATEVFAEAGIDNPDNIHVVPAGVKTKPSLLQDDDDMWLGVLWYTVFDLASDDGQSVLTRHNINRIKQLSKVDPSDFKKELYDQPIIIPKNWKDRVKDKLPVVGAALGSGGAAGITGATIGATIGALAIGIPSFGIAAGVGLLVGAAIGGGTGVGVSVLTAKAVAAVRKRKKAQAEETEEASKPV